jgi:hypothetical protein
VLDAAGLEWDDLFGPGDGDTVQGEVTGVDAVSPRHLVTGDPGLVARAYEALLAQLPLEDGHRENLRRRACPTRRSTAASTAASGA